MNFQTSNFPLVLFDKNNKILTRKILINNNNLFIRGNQIFAIEIVDSVNSESILFNAELNPTPIGQDDLFIVTQHPTMLTGKNNYSIFLTKDIAIRVSGADGTNYVYLITVNQTNTITEANEHYLDYLDNNYLPRFEELEPAIISNNKADLIKRLLLDFKNIRQSIGTTESISKFLFFIGFDPNSIKIFPEWKRPNGTKTLSPDTTKDVKTGYYHVLYDNWIVDPNDKYTPKNLPKRILNITDLEEFFDKLYYAIGLANKYFTVKEQDISYFGLANSSNGERFLSVTSNASKIYENDIYYFSKHIKIDLFQYTDDGLFEIFLVKNNTQITKDSSKTEVKWRKADPLINTEIFLIDEELFGDDFEITDYSSFSCLLHLKIDVTTLWNVNVNRSYYYKYKIVNKANPFIVLELPNKVLLDNGYLIEIPFIINTDGGYDMIIEFWDDHNNREQYNYELNLSAENAMIDFQLFNSSELVDENNLNQLQQHISSSSISNLPLMTQNYILPQNLVPLMLNEYYQFTPQAEFQYIYDNEYYQLPSINQFYSVNEVTETIPTGLLDMFLHVYGLKLKTGYTLMYRYTDKFNYTKYVSVVDVDIDSDSQYSFNGSINGFVKILDIFEEYDPNVDYNTETPEKYYFISAKSPGVELNKNTYDLVMVNDNDPDDILSIYDENTEDIDNVKIPVNFSFILFDEFDKDFKIDSLFQRLINIAESTNDTYQLRIGDVFVAIPDNKYIVEATDITWKVYNTFEPEVPIYEYVGLALKYRIDLNLIFDIELSFKIGNQTYKIYKNSIVSSF